MLGRAIMAVMPPTSPPTGVSTNLQASTPFSTAESHALALDREDGLAACRGEFVFPEALRPKSQGEGGKRGGSECVYLVGNSLGLMPRRAREAVEAELGAWETLGVEAHLAGAGAGSPRGREPWYSYHEVFRETGARLVGARPGEVVMMNSLTTNLHLMMVSFYRPTSFRFKIVVEDSLFPSDSYAVASQAAFHGFDPSEAIVRLKPREGEATLRTEDILEYLEADGKSVALVLLGGVNYLTGQWFEMEKITRAAKARGCVVGWDLAHAAGSVPMQLHDWGVDFAVWCSYKYLNAGPGAVAGCFVHEEHGRRVDLPRFAGWWGNDPSTRFKMGPDFVPRPGADGWQLSNPPILAMAPLRASLEIFDRVGMAALRAKSLALTTYMRQLLEAVVGDAIRVLTPREDSQRGGHLSLAVTPPPTTPTTAGGKVAAGAGGGGRNPSRELFEKLLPAGIVCDFREPNVIRAAPAALYCSFHDVWRFATALGGLMGAPAGGGRQGP